MQLFTSASYNPQDQPSEMTPQNIDSAEEILQKKWVWKGVCGKDKKDELTSRIPKTRDRQSGKMPDKDQRLEIVVR